MDLEEIDINVRNLVDSAQDYWRALVNAALNLRVPQAMELVIDTAGTVPEDSSNAPAGVRTGYV